MGGVGSRPVEQSVFMPAAKTLAIILNVRLLGRSRPDRQSCCKGATVTPARLLVESHDTSRLRGEPATGWQETEQGSRAYGSVTAAAGGRSMGSRRPARERRGCCRVTGT